MIRYVRGNILESTCEAICNPVNCLGVMGAGLAKQFAQKFPKMVETYKEACSRQQIYPGGIQIWWGDTDSIYPQKIIVNIATKDDWRNPSKLEWVKEGLWSLRDKLEYFRLTSVAIPPLGCGLGGLNWQDVMEAIEAEFGNSDIDVEVYEPM